MAEAGGFRRRERSIFTREIRVLLVDPDKEYLSYLAELLQSCSCKVKAVERAATALSILSERKEEFDLLIADIHSPDLDPLTLLRLTINMDVLAIPMSAEKDDTMLRKAIEIGALLYLEKPATTEMLKYMWQMVMREKIRKGIKLEDEGRPSETTGENDKRSNESKGKMPEEDIVSETINKKDKYVPKKRVRGRKSRKNDEDSESINYYNGRVKKKVCTEWTEELHQKFIDAVNQLGEGRCYPKEILELMNVPGLTRMQVASHLQKCRNDNWRAPEIRRSNPSSSNLTGSGTEGSAWKINSRKFGSMPFLLKDPNHAQVNLKDGHENHTAPQTFSANKEQTPENGNLETVKPMDNTENEVEATVNGDINTTEMSNLNVNEEVVVQTNMADHQNYYHPILSDINSAKHGIYQCHANSSIQKHPHPPDHFFDFIPEMDDFMQNYPGFHQGSMNNHSLGSQQYVFGFNQVFSQQFPMDPNGQTRGQFR